MKNYRKIKLQDKRDAVAAMWCGIILVPVITFIGCIVYGAVYPHGAVARGLVILFKAASI